MELSALGLSEEQLAGVNDYAAGLKAKNDELLGEKKAEQQKAKDANEATELARQAAATAKEQELVATGKTDELKAHYEEQLALKIAEANQSAEKAKGMLTERDKSAVVSSILSNVDDRYKAFVETQLNGNVSISYDESGKAVTNIKDGDASYDSPSNFLDGVKESETWKHVLKATSLSGAGTKQSGSDGATNNNNSVQSKLSARLKASGLT